MTLRLLGSLLYTLAMLALFGAIVGMGFMPLITSGYEWYQHALIGGFVPLFFPGMHYTIGVLLAVVTREQEAFMTGVLPVWRLHDPVHWVRSLRKARRHSI